MIQTDPALIATLNSKLRMPGRRSWAAIPTQSTAPAEIVEMVLKYVAAIYEPDDIVEIRRLSSTAASSTWHLANRLADQIPVLLTKNRLSGQNIYIGVNPRSSANVRGDENVKLARTIFADFDNTIVEQARQRIQSAGLPLPTLIVNSGHGVHAYWKLVEPFTILADWNDLQKDLADSLDSDPKICNAERIMRLPGFCNLKEPRAECEIVDCEPMRAYSLLELRTAIPVRLKAAPVATTNIGPISGIADDERLKRCRAYVAKMPPSIQGQNGSDDLLAVACECFRFGLSDESAQVVVAEYNATKCEPAWSDKEITHKLDNARSIVGGDFGTRLSKPVAKPATVQQVEAFTPFPVSELHPVLAKYVREAAAAIGSDESGIAVVLLAALATAIGNSRQVRIKRNWHEPSILWIMLIAVTGSKKTPILVAGLQFILNYQRKLHKEYQANIVAYNTALCEWQAAPKDGRPAEKPVKPDYPHVYVDDSTIEALAVVLERTPRGVLLYRDELSGWLKSFNAYKNGGGDEQAYLPLFNAAPLKITRKNIDQPNIYIPRASVSIAGGIQPEVLRAAFTPDRFNNGLASRFLFVFPPELPGPGWTENEIDPATADGVADIFGKLFDLGTDDGQPVLVHLSPAAKSMFARYVDKLKADRLELNGSAFAGALSKFEALPARLSLILQMVHDAAENQQQCPFDATGNPQPEYISDQAMRSALAITHWFINESRRVYSFLGQHSAQALANDRESLVELIRRLGGRVTPRQIRQHCRQYPTSEAAEIALVELSKAGVGKWVLTPPSPKGGPPSRHFMLATSGTT